MPCYLYISCIYIVCASRINYNNNNSNKYYYYNSNSITTNSYLFFVFDIALGMVVLLFTKNSLLSSYNSGNECVNGLLTI